MKLSEKFNEALTFAATLHADQARKGTDIPYISHPMSVSAIVIESGGTEDEAIAALLHDTIEDVGARVREDIRRKFGENVLEIVEGMTDTDEQPKPPWLDRKKAYLARLREASASVRLVKAADTLHNARAVVRDYRLIGEKVWRRFSAGKKDVLWFYRSVFDVLSKAGTNPLVDELGRVIEELESLTAE